MVKNKEAQSREKLNALETYFHNAALNKLTAEVRKATNDIRKLADRFEDAAGSDITLDGDHTVMTLPLCEVISQIEDQLVALMLPYTKQGIVREFVEDMFLKGVKIPE